MSKPQSGSLCAIDTYVDTLELKTHNVNSPRGCGMFGFFALWDLFDWCINFLYENIILVLAL